MNKERKNLIFRRLEQLESLLERVDHNSRSQVEELTAQIHGKTSEVSGLQLENERLKVSETVIFNPLHSERPKLSTILAFLSAIGLRPCGFFCWSVFDIKVVNFDINNIISSEIYVLNLLPYGTQCGQNSIEYWPY